MEAKFYSHYTQLAWLSQKNKLLSCLCLWGLLSIPANIYIKWYNKLTNSKCSCWNEKCLFKGSHSWILGPHLVALFGELIELLGHWALLEEVSHWKWDLKTYNFTPLPLFFLCLLYAAEMSSLNFMIFQKIRVGLPYPYGHPDLWNCKRR